MALKNIARKIFHKNFLILSIILSVCTNASCGGELDRELSVEDFYMVQNQLPVHIFRDWIKIGVLLHVKPLVLNTIADQYTNDPHGAHTKMLHKWLTGCTMSNDMRKPTLRELAMVIGASCGGARPLDAKNIFIQHGDGETYESALKNLREDAKTIHGQKNNDWAFVEHLISIYFLSEENFSDSDALDKRLDLAHAPDAAIPFLFAGFYPCATSQPTLFSLGVSMFVPPREAARITRSSSCISVSELSVVLFELLFYALNNRPEALKWMTVCQAMCREGSNSRTAKFMQNAISVNLGLTI